MFFTYLPKSVRFWNPSYWDLFLFHTLPMSTFSFRLFVLSLPGLGIVTYVFYIHTAWDDWLKLVLVNDLPTIQRLGFQVRHPYNTKTLFVLFFSVRLLSVLRGHSVFSPRHKGQWPPTSKDFLSHILSITFHILILEKEPVFSILNVQC
mgnify:CR=1 FL=1